MTEKSQRARKDTATVAEASPPPAATATEAETPDLRSLLEQVLTKLSSMDTRSSTLENKATTSEALSSEGSPAQGGRLPGAALRRALEGPTVEEMEADRLRMDQEEVSRTKNKNKPQVMPVVKPMASKAHSPHIMDVVTINDYQHYLQAFKVTLRQFQTVPKFRPQDFEKAGLSFDVNLIFLTNLDPQLQVNFLKGRDFEEVARVYSFDQLNQAVLKWLFDRVFQNDLGQWCKMNRQLESQEVAVHNNKLRIIIPHFPIELSCNLGRIQVFETYSDSIKETLLANGQVDKTDLPTVEVMFERAIAAEKLLQQLQHGTIMRTANSARYSDRRDDPQVMALLREQPPPHVMAVVRDPPPALGFQFPPPPQLTPRNGPRPNLEYRSTADGYSVFLTADASEVLEPSTWMPVNPVQESKSNPRAISHLASYTNTAHDPEALKKVAGYIPSIVYGLHDTDFHDLSDPPYTHYVVGRAIPEYANKLELAPPLVLAITQELNHGKLEPTSSQIQEAAGLLARTVHAFCTLCPALAPQFQQIGYNRDKALKITGENRCWRCGKPGHIAAHCPTPKAEVYATDRLKK